ncbi:MAG: iron ABC transporter permease [Desulfurobacteriaceae bacterium]
MQKLLKAFLITLVTAFSFLFSLFVGLPEVNKTIVFQLRLPELILAFAVGGILSISGGIFQGIFRNPLADPYILGVSAGSAFGATLSAWKGWNVEVGALLGGIISVFLIFLASIFLRENLRIILFGIGLNAFFSALILFFFAIIPFYSIQDALFFSLGYIPSVELTTSLVYLNLAILMLTIFLAISPRIDSLSLGEELSYFSGISTFEKVIYIILVSSFVSVFIAKTGIIGFVGIVVPHAVRLLGFRILRELLPFSFILGGSVLVFSQGMAKTILSPVVLPVGVITSLIGVPAFLFIVWRYSLVRS